MIVFCLFIIGFTVVFFFGSLNNKTDQQLMQFKYEDQNVLVLKPRLTETAYSDHGFYWYYDGRCDESCLSISLKQGEPNRWGTYNQKTVQLFSMLGWPIMNDSLVHEYLVKDPDFLNHFDTIIILHNEYVTQELFQAITNHQNVIYLFPNAMYAEVTFDGKVMQLVRGHNYPDASIRNGFGWNHDNSELEYDIECSTWQFDKISNGHMLNCYPEKILQDRPEILLKLKELV